MQRVQSELKEPSDRIFSRILNISREENKEINDQYQTADQAEQ